MVAAAVCAGALALPCAASADTIAVGIQTDEYMAGAGTGCSLREAIETANRDTNFGDCTEVGGGNGPDTINVPPGTYTVTQVGADDTNVGGDFDVRRDPANMTDEGVDLNIIGAGDGISPAVDTIIDLNLGGVATRAFDVQDDTAPTNASDFAIEEMRIQDGVPGVGADGGAIQFLDQGGTLAVRRSSLAANNAGDDGGAIAVAPSLNGGSHSLQLIDSEVTGNAAGDEGGGVWVAPPGPSPSGDNSVEVTGSTLYQNSTDATTGGAGGGIYIEGAGRLDLLDSTVDMNSARLGGGGVAFGSSQPEFHSQFSTIADNTAPVSATTMDGGAGLQMDTDTNFVYLEGTILDNNHLADMTPSNCGELSTGSSDGDFHVVHSTLGYNLESANTCEMGFSAGETCCTSTQLLPLADNGGETRTMALGAMSPARDLVPNSPTDNCRYTERFMLGSNILNLTQDQRGLPRPTMGALCDIGAYEDASTAVADTATVTQGVGATAIGVLANDTDPDGGVMRIASVSDPAGGTTAITGGGTGLTYQPDAGLCGSDPFTYTLNAGSVATVSVAVTCAPSSGGGGTTTPTTPTPTKKKCKKKRKKGAAAAKKCKRKKK